MGPLHQNKGFKRELEQKWGIFKKERLKFWPIFPYILGNIWENVQVGANFDMSELGNRLE